MQYVAYGYRSPAGSFTIRPEPDGRWRLCVDDVCLGHYASPALVADDVHMHATGWSEWDLRMSYEAPADLDEWDQILEK